MSIHILNIYCSDFHPTCKECSNTTNSISVVHHLVSNKNHIQQAEDNRRCVSAKYLSHIQSLKASIILIDNVNSQRHFHGAGGGISVMFCWYHCLDLRGRHENGQPLLERLVFLICQVDRLLFLGIFFFIGSNSVHYSKQGLKSINPPLWSISYIRKVHTTKYPWIMSSGKKLSRAKKNRIWKQHLMKAV